MSIFTLTDAAIERALTPGLDVAAPNDFSEKIATAIAPMPRRSRGWLVGPAAWPRRWALVTQLILLLLVLLVLFAGAVVVASLRPKPLANGHVVVARGSELLAIDPATGASSTLVTKIGDLFGVTRSLDGSLISFWITTPSGTALEIVGDSGGTSRRVAANVVPAPVARRQVDVWSPDGRWLAAGVLSGADERILLVDVASGNGQLVGPRGASNPLWSPDGQMLAFSYARNERSVLAVMHADGSGLAEVSGDLGAFNASGANNWSPNGSWVYFGAERTNFLESNIYRANVAGRYSEQLTFNSLSAAPALSPDGRSVSYSNWPLGRGTPNLMLMDADGGNPRLLLGSAMNDGWSNDGQFLLTEWRPPGSAFELLLIRPDGSDRHTLMTFEGGCVSVCAPNLGWGQPRP